MGLDKVEIENKIIEYLNQKRHAFLSGISATLSQHLGRLIDDERELQPILDDMISTGKLIVEETIVGKKYSLPENLTAKETPEPSPSSTTCAIAPEVGNRIRFKLLDEILNPLENLIKFNCISLGNNIFEVDYDPKLEMLEGLELIKIYWEKPRKFNGPPEQIKYDGHWKIIQPNKEGSDFTLLDPGIFICKRCGEIFAIPQEPGNERTPNICPNEDCARKGPFDLKTAFLAPEIWPPLSYPEPIDTLELHAMIKKYLEDHIQFPEPELYTIIPIWIMLTWVQEEFKAYPYIYLLGPPESGKTRCLEIFEQLCYHSLFAAAIRGPAAIYRSIEQYHPALLIDEVEPIMNTESGDKDVQAVLNSGYKKGPKVIICVASSDDWKIRAFDVTGPKAFGGTYEPYHVLETRSILITMMRNTVPVADEIDEEKAQKIRKHLLYWRYTTLSNLPRKKFRIEGWGRLTEIFKPLVTIYDHTDVHRYIEKIKAARQVSESQQLDAIVLEGVAQYWNQEYCNIKDVSDYVAQETTLEPKKIPPKVGRVLKRLGIVKKRKPGSGNVIVDLSEPENRVRLSRYFERYKIAIDSKLPQDILKECGQCNQQFKIDEMERGPLGMGLVCKKCLEDTQKKVREGL